MDKRVQGWSQFPYGQQHLVRAQGVEGIFEVQLDNPMMVIKVTGIHPRNMDCCFRTSLDAKPELPWCQEGSQLLHFARSNLCDKVSQGTIHCDGTNLTVFLVKGSQVGPEEEWLNGQWRSALQRQLHKAGKSGE